MDPSEIQLEPKKSWLSAHHVLGYVFLIAIFAAAVAGIYYWQTVSNLPSGYTAPAHVDPTANWQTYTDTNNGFTLKYPTSLYTEDDSDAFILKSSSRPDYQIYDGGGVSPDGVEGQDWVRGYEISFVKDPIQGVSLENSEDYQVTKQDVSQINAYAISGDAPGTEYYIQVPQQPNSFIEVGYNTGLTPTDESDKIFHQILSTFKFILATTSNNSSVSSNPPQAVTDSNAIPPLPPAGWDAIQKNSYMLDDSDYTGSNGTHVVFVSPTGVRVTIPDQIAAAIDSALATQNGQEIESLAMPIDPINPGLIYLSTSESSNDYESSSINRVYSYDLKNAILTKIFEETAQNDNPYSETFPRILRTVGMDGTKLILMEDDIESSPGPCASIWSDAKNQMLYLDINSTNSSLQKYTVPQKIVDLNAAYEQECENSF